MFSSLFKSAAIFAAIIFALAAGAESPRIATSPAFDSQSGALDSFNVKVSSDGRFVLFLSAAKDLDVQTGADPSLDLYLHNVKSGANQLIASSLAAGIRSPGTSANGLRVVFEAPRLDALHGEQFSQVYLWETGMVKLVSINSQAVPANAPAISPRLSADGNFVVFQSRATNLASNSPSEGIHWQIYRHDITSGETLLVSAADAIAGNGDSTDPVISADGRQIAFISSAYNLSGTNAASCLLWNSGTFHNASSGASEFAASYKGSMGPVALAGDCLFFWAEGEAGLAALLYYNSSTDTLNALATNEIQNVNLNNYSISSNGNFVVVQESNHIYRVHADSGSRLLVAGTTEPVRNPAISPDGSRVAFTDAHSGTNTGKIYIRNMISGQTVQIATNTYPTSQYSSGRFSWPDSGAFLVFDSSHRYLVENDFNESSDVYTYQLASGQIDLISRRHDNLPSASSLGQSILEHNSLDASGRYLVFASWASDLGDPGLGELNIILADLATGTKHVISTNTVTADFAPIISPNGRFISYGSGAYDPVNTFAFSGHTYDRILEQIVDTNTVVSFSSNGMIRVFGRRFQRGPIGTGSELFNAATEQPLSLTVPPFNTPTFPTLTLNGEFLIIGSPSGFNSSFFNGLFLVKVGTNEVQRFEFLEDSSFDYETRTRPFISADGRKVAFAAQPVQASHVYLGDIETAKFSLVASNAQNPSISGNGLLVAYQTTNQNIAQVAVTFTDTGSTEILSRNNLGQFGNADSTLPSITPDGRFVVFASKATNLVENDTNGRMDIFVHDRFNGQTLLLSANSNGTASANNTSYNPILGQDGKTVLFQSFASDIVPNDFNQKSDIFYVRLTSDDSDNDGLPDDWEIAHFENLMANPDADADQDGLTNQQEYRAGTSPTNNQSVLTVMTLGGVGTSSKNLIWSTIPGKTYIVQAKDHIEDPWQNISSLIPATTTQAAFTDETSLPTRFYRVLLAD